ncbi:SUKH-4 family immunity protein [Nocardia seriolae]|uniref:SUKH-4 immunity protein of toxin-antitoxin system n=1 Tax=Nocardia seriolae TaxID=37332 RepID=A0A0B8NDN4_9NOCA|nr:SUKH-4 family immunity protein [Nocardia seriolae]MTJ64273.1 hypothetical protein [Nocardia seriolae]MTJ72875.1 hypothetical protein [Nocardia seriolae]MTJ89264.1 hypothetical protein [Nocardia seriolae]MTK33242.1 hypothetical protein [Nocardia seriolae]MTK40563.1 hypothetical protein [Nocardia seriolae]
MVPVPHLIDRATLETVFPAADLITLPDDATLGSVPHAPSREFLRDIGIPGSMWLAVHDELRAGRLDCSNQDLAEAFPEFDIDFGRWALLGAISGDPVYLDVTGGAVFSIPDGGLPARLNTGLAAFVRFLYLLEIERPNYDFEISGANGYRPGAEHRLRELMTACDPRAFDPPDTDSEFEPGEPTWELVLRFVAERLQ